LDGLERQSLEGARFGFTGKQVIHPAQVPVVQRAFSPAPDRVEWARALIAAFEEQQAEGRGAFSFRGHMIDMPTVKQARNVLSLISQRDTTVDEK
jgi:citrate lyase subunit beta-like protein